MRVGSLAGIDLLCNARSPSLSLSVAGVASVDRGCVEILVVIAADVVKLLVGSKLVPSADCRRVE